MSQTHIDRRSVLGVPVDLASFEEILRSILEWRARGARNYIVFTNPHSIMTCQRDTRMMAATRNGSLVLADGVGTTLAMRVLYGLRSNRLPGPELMLRLFDAGQGAGLRHYLYGGKPDVVGKLRRHLQQMFPRALICGAFSPPFRTLTPEEDEADMQRISATKPDIVWVGLGAPKQEKWMAEHIGRVDAPAMLGVGAAFDFHAGEVAWAPTWVRRTGVEWAFRLLQEPKRLWRRNLDSPRFAARVLGQKLGMLG
jgi:N-acetylglucosaminyldiphosphoundecaprenol N-acetyl-beta-D-mannosaminyltransferase